jgi:heme-degrading monooxygenase HmoA
MVRGGAVMYVRVIQARLTQGDKRSLAERVRGKVPKADGYPGVIGYYVVDLGPDRFATVGIFEDAQAADRWADAVRGYVEDNDLRQHVATDEGAAVVFAGPATLLLSR